MPGEILVQPMLTEIEPGGRLVLSQVFLSSAGLREGDHVILFPINPGQLYLYKVAAPRPLSPDELRALIRDTFARSGYTTREQVLSLVREAKQELAQEW